MGRRLYRGSPAALQQAMRSRRGVQARERGQKPKKLAVGTETLCYERHGRPMTDAVPCQLVFFHHGHGGNRKSRRDNASPCVGQNRTLPVALARGPGLRFDQTLEAHVARCVRCASTSRHNSQVSCGVAALVSLLLH